ncbi:hypothetical protein D9619_011444 [Psilocybe cf. subviscida]|uniref:Uncharacterized protein n=1 Tax=Psilocybe cf. subviscida TaxID=2480587 RepID=A0A8H5BT15_9AGAR|nr:hypothetical protein D9619_011444 [Psilocybe cf. subviscida]
MKRSRTSRNFIENRIDSCLSAFRKRVMVISGTAVSMFRGVWFGGSTHARALAEFCDAAASSLRCAAHQILDTPVSFNILKRHFHDHLRGTAHISEQDGTFHSVAPGAYIFSILLRLRACFRVLRSSLILHLGPLSAPSRRRSHLFISCLPVRTSM